MTKQVTPTIVFYADQGPADASRLSVLLGVVRLVTKPVHWIIVSDKHVPGAKLNKGSVWESRPSAASLEDVSPYAVVLQLAKTQPPESDIGLGTLPISGDLDPKQIAAKLQDHLYPKPVKTEGEG